MKFFRHRFPRLIVPAALALSLLTSCEQEKRRPPEEKPPVKAAGEQPPQKAKPGKSKKAPAVAQSSAPADLSKSIEAFTGAHTRLVWAKCAKPNAGDSFAQREDLLLMGIDTQDGKGERAILPNQGNYSKPLLSVNGETIIYTDKNTVRKGSKKHYRPLIYRTDWKGSKPVKLGEGYAVDCWADPATGVEYVYAVLEFKPTKGLALEGARLVRFPLADPAKVELMYDDTPITPDNVQLSRDGTRASGQFPWPHAGILTLSGGQYTARKLTTGCWTSMAPDNSGVAWTFDGGHREFAMTANDGDKFWQLHLNQAAGMPDSELFHPRWSNHPQFIVVTGPYMKGEGVDGSVINRGGGAAQVFLGHLSEDATKVEGWLQVSHADSGESYPDAWIAGGEKANLKGYAIPAGAAGGTQVATAAWPASKAGLLYLWKDRVTLNAYTTRDGKKHEAVPEGHGAARFGRMGELLVDGGSYEGNPETTADTLAHFQTKPEATWEALVLPPAAEGTPPATPPGVLFGAPGFVLSDAAGRLVVARDASVWRSKEALPATPFHLVVVRGAQGFEAHVNGEPLELEPASGVPASPAPPTLTFGGGWNGGLMNVALYDRAITAEEIASNATAAKARIAAFPAAPARVKVQARLVEVSAMPTPEAIAPYTSSLVAYVYEVEKVLEGALEGKTVLVKHWAMLDEKAAQGFPREAGKSYELLLEREQDQPQLKGERVMDDTTAFDQTAWFDVAPPRVAP